MAIKIYPDKIEIVSGPQTYTLRAYGGVKGASFTGKMTARSYGGAAASIYQGTVSGFASGGLINPLNPSVNTIQKFPFATNANATDYGDMTEIRYGAAGHSSPVSGYRTGGFGPISNTIDKFPFATNANATDVGDMTISTHVHASQQSPTHAYNAGGVQPPGTWWNNIDRFPFATNANATDVGDMILARYGNAGQSSATHGFNSGGFLAPPVGPAAQPRSEIDIYPFATNSNAIYFGAMVAVQYHRAGHSSPTHGYNSSGVWVTSIDKFPFATFANAAAVGGLTQGRAGPAGISSQTDGYAAGGGLPPTIPRGRGVYSSNIIDKFPFATDTNASDVGDLLQPVAYVAGQQD